MCDVLFSFQVSQLGICVNGHARAPRFLGVGGHHSRVGVDVCL